MAQVKHAFFFSKFNPIPEIQPFIIKKVHLLKKRGAFYGIENQQSKEAK